MDKKIAIMQPYFFPYIGYWQLINAADSFVLYDEGLYIPRGWMHRNRIMSASGASYFGLVIKNRSANCCIKDVQISLELIDVSKMLRTIYFNYKRAKFFDETMPLIEDILNHVESNLFNFLKYQIERVNEHLDIKTSIFVASEIEKRESSNAVEKIFAICNAMDIHNYINPIGGMKYYDKKFFKDNDNIDLHFLKTRDDILYTQVGGKPFVENMSVIDMLMCCGKEQTKVYLDSYDLI